MPPSNQPLPDARALTVYFDGSCPLCRREISVYRGLQSARPVCYEDVSQKGCVLPPGTDRTRLLARFHVRDAEGRIVSGAAAFLALWQVLPGWRWLGRVGSLPLAAGLLEAAYSGFLRLRPSLQALARALEVPAAPAGLVADLRSDHAGETGAVWIYLGILAVARAPVVRAFARRHLATEREHLRRISTVLPLLRRSWLLVPWRIAGFLTGALPAAFGARAVFATIAAVETFVDQHYQQQIDQLPAGGAHEALRALMLECQADERHHRDEAAGLQGREAGFALSAWCALVGRGSAIAVRLARVV